MIYLTPPTPPSTPGETGHRGRYRDRLGPDPMVGCTTWDATGGDTREGRENEKDGPCPGIGGSERVRAEGGSSTVETIERTGVGRGDDPPTDEEGRSGARGFGGRKSSDPFAPDPSLP